MAKENREGVVVITGGSGLVGRRLTALLVSRGYIVRVLSRNRVLIPGAKVYLWDYRSGTIESGALEGAGHIIHLAGASIGTGRWTSDRKREIVESRTLSAGFLARQVRSRGIELLSFISASATGYYGAITSDHIFIEDDLPGSDFAATTSVMWEESARQFEKLAGRVVILRTGIVLSPTGGMLGSLTPLVRSRLLPLFGDGSHWVPWIHLDDLCGIYLMALAESSLYGTFNAVAPEPVTYDTLVKQLAASMNRRVISPSTPSFIWKIIFGEKSALLLTGSRVSSVKIREEGYQFLFPDSLSALNSLPLQR